MPKNRFQLKLKTIWIIVVALLIPNFVLQDLLLNPSDDQRNFGAFIWMLYSATVMIIFFGIGAGVGALFAFIPYKKRTYAKKFERAFPLSTGVILIFLLFVFGYGLYMRDVMGFDFKSMKKYDDVVIPPNLDCTDIKNGAFESENITITREGDRQIQVNKETSVRIEYEVDWKSDCEYFLTPIDDPTYVLKVKVVGVQADHYECLVSTDKYAHRYIVRRL